MERSDQGSGESDIGGMSEDTVFKPVQIEKNRTRQSCDSLEDGSMGKGWNPVKD